MDQMKLDAEEKHQKSIDEKLKQTREGMPHNGVGDGGASEPQKFGQSNFDIF